MKIRNQPETVDPNIALTLISQWLLFFSSLKVLAEWNKGELDSFLIEITKDILAYKDSDGAPLVEKIRDSAGQVRRLFIF